MEDDDVWEGLSSSSGEETRTDVCSSSNSANTLPSTSLLSLNEQILGRRPPEKQVFSTSEIDFSEDSSPFPSQEPDLYAARAFTYTGDLERLITGSASLVPVDDTASSVWEEVKPKVKHRAGKLDAIKRVSFSSKSVPWPTKFPNCSAYREHFQAMISCEFEVVRVDRDTILQEAKMIRQAGYQQAIEIEVNLTSSTKRKELVFELPSIDDFFCGDSLYLHSKYISEFPDIGRICDIDGPNNLVTVDIGEHLELVVAVTFASSYVIDKMLETLGNFSPLHPFAETLLGNIGILGNEPIQVSPFSEQHLNPAQNKALTNALLRSFTLIQGPPGTGKTRIAAELVGQFSGRADGNILVCASSNIAADNLAIAIHKANPELNMVRLYSHGKENTLTPSTKDFAFHFLLRDRLISKYPTYRYLLSILPKPTRKMMADIFAKDENIHFKSEVEDFLSTVEIICCTCVTSVNRLLDCIQFRYVILDEAAFSPEPETLLALKDTCRKVVLIGDQKQLPPVVLSDQAKQWGYGRSLFERLLTCGMQPTLLNVQYRMLPELSVFPRNVFYNGKLKDDESVLRVQIPVEIQQYFRTSPLVLINCQGTESQPSNSFSYFNEIEAEEVITVLNDFHKLGILGQSIGVITAYDAQRRKILEKTKRLKYESWVKELEVKSVDGYQGREKDVIVISTVRANGGGNIGFLADKRRINVALTRAKFGLVLIGDQEVLMNNETWRRFIEHGRANGDQREI